MTSGFRLLVKHGGFFLADFVGLGKTMIARLIAKKFIFLQRHCKCGMPFLTLRRLQNFALDMDWIPKAVVPKQQWPAIQFKDKQAITFAEHRIIVESEKNPERKRFYELCWHLGGSQRDIGCLSAEDVEWENRTIYFTRTKTVVPVSLHLGEESLNALKDLPGEGLLFP